MKRASHISAVSLAVVLAYSTFIAPAFSTDSPAVAQNPLREAYFGDLHLHTEYSFDAYVMSGTTLDPGDAYRFAKGEEVAYLGQRVKRREPLDFLAVTDHSESIGVFNQLEDPNSAISKSDIGRQIKAAHLAAIADPSKQKTFLDLILHARDMDLPPEIKATSVSAWQREMDFANRNNEPGKFTTFIAYEWTSMPGGDVNLHRNVIFKGDTAPAPFTAKDSTDPEDLWRWLEDIRKQGYEALAVPHNGNASNGLMYDWTTLNGKPIDRAYAELRQANEPLTEISQGKGSSETHPTLSPTDEFANFEIMDITLISVSYSKPPGSYVRDALGRGLVLQRQLGVNPYKLGVEGGSDMHSGLSVSAQADYAGDVANVNIGPGKPTKEQAAKLLRVTGDKKPVTGYPLLLTTAGNLTGVWAESNTRESIYSALRRKEAFATSGSRLKFRFFGGWKMDKRLLDQKDWVKTAYAKDAPMGGDLPSDRGGAAAPSFAIWATKDPNSANLDRVQVIKVWEEGGQEKEKIFDVVWSGHRKPDAKTGKLPAVGDTVDLKTGQYSNTIGAAELKTVWTDPEFNPNHLAAYYLRVLEIPTARWSTLLAIEDGLPLSPDVPATEQQRGWSSPIWYTPKGL